MSSNQDQAQARDVLRGAPVKKSTGEGSDSALSEMLKKRREACGDADPAPDQGSDDSAASDGSR